MLTPEPTTHFSYAVTEEIPAFYLSGITLDGMFREMNPTPTRPLWKKQLLSTLAAVATCSSMSVQALSLIGDTIDGSLTDTLSLAPGAIPGVVTTPFSPSTVVVGAGDEFFGVWSYSPFGQNWNISVDVGATSFSVLMRDVNTAPSSHDISSPQLFRIVLSNLDLGADISGVTLRAGSPTGVKSIGFGAHQASVEWQTIPGQDSRYTFDFLTAAAPDEPTVPAPMPLLLFALGLGAITYVRVPEVPARKH